MGSNTEIKGSCPNCGAFVFVDERRYMIDHAPLVVEMSGSCPHCGARLSMVIKAKEDRTIECTIKGTVPHD